MMTGFWNLLPNRSWLLAKKCQWPSFSTIESLSWAPSDFFRNLIFALFSVRRPHTHYWCIFAENISFNKEDIYTKKCRPFLVHQGEDQILEDRSCVAIYNQRMTKFPLLFYTMEWYALWVQNWPSYNAKGKWFINGRGRVRLHGGGKSYITYVPFPQYMIPVIPL